MSQQFDFSFSFPPGFIIAQYEKEKEKKNNKKYGMNFKKR